MKRKREEEEDGAPFCHLPTFEFVSSICFLQISEEIGKVTPSYFEGLTFVLLLEMSASETEADTDLSESQII